jgi:hypothetical protein
MAWVWKVIGSVAVLLVAGSTLIFFWTLSSGEFLGEGDAWYERSPMKEAIAFSLMLLGMTARYFTKAIEERRAKYTADPTKKHSIRFDFWEFSYPLFVSVITFGVLLQQLGSEELNLANLVLSFQTGFFWQTILGRSDNIPVTARQVPGG